MEKNIIKMKNCQHKRIKRNFPFGKKSNPRRYCKDCGEPIQSIKPKNKKKKRKVKQDFNFKDNN